MAGGTSCLSLTCSIIGILFATVSVAGIGLSLFLVFGEPYSQKNVQGTYSPNWEDIGPALVVSVVSLLANVFLIGGSRQLSKDFLLVWISWKIIAILIFWSWYGYNQLKNYDYIDWSQYGMKNCAFCGIPESSYVVFGGVGVTVVLLFCMVPVELLRSKLKKRHIELTEPLGLYDSEHNLSPYQQNQQQQRYEMYQQQQNQMLRQQVLQNYQQYPPPNEHEHHNTPQDYYHSQQWQYYPAASSQNVQYH